MYFYIYATDDGEIHTFTSVEELDAHAKQNYQKLIAMKNIKVHKLDGEVQIID